MKNLISLLRTNNPFKEIFIVKFNFLLPNNVKIK